MVGTVEAEVWASELDALLGGVGGRFGRVDLRWRMRDYARGLLAPVGRKNGWQLAEWAGHRDPAGMQHLLGGARWDTDALRDDVRDYVGDRLGPGGVLIIDDTFRVCPVNGVTEPLKLPLDRGHLETGILRFQRK
ncbi:transposase [Streptomyces sp. NPDC127084]|uniref:transposase n=1 Tax=Streptomyces sp. NPDC127084 TaxID=3347133 RepID=UPI003664F288